MAPPTKISIGTSTPLTRWNATHKCDNKHAATDKYKRNGISNPYAALDVASSKVITKMTVAHRAVEFSELTDKKVSEELDVHIILDKDTQPLRPNR